MTSQSTAPLTCPNGHAMDEGLFECPCCGAYRPSANDPAALIKNGRVVGVKPPAKTDMMPCCSCGSPVPFGQAVAIGVCDDCWNMAMGL